MCMFLIVDNRHNAYVPNSIALVTLLAKEKREQINYFRRSFYWFLFSYFIFVIFLKIRFVCLCNFYVFYLHYSYIVNINHESHWKYFRFSYEWCRTVLSDENTSFMLDDRCAAASVIYNLNVNRFEQRK